MPLLIFTILLLGKPPYDFHTVVLMLISSVLIYRTFFVFFTIFCFAHMLYLQIVYIELLSAKLANVLVVCTAEPAVALVVEIITLCHIDFSLIIKNVFLLSDEAVQS